MKRAFAIPSSAALGVGLSGCLGASLPGEWDATAWMGVLMPFEYSPGWYGSYTFSAAASLTIEGDRAVEAELTLTYGYGGEGYSERYRYFGAITREGRRQYEINVQQRRSAYELVLDCALRERDLLDCDSDGEVFTFEREG